MDIFTADTRANALGGPSAVKFAAKSVAAPASRA